MKGKSGSPPASEPAAEQNDQAPAGSADGEEEDVLNLKLLWQDLMADLGRVILSAHEADPHRFDEPRDDGWKKSFGIAIALLIGGAASFTASIQSVLF